MFILGMDVISYVGTYVCKCLCMYVCLFVCMYVFIDMSFLTNMLFVIISNRGRTYSWVQCHEIKIMEFPRKLDMLCSHHSLHVDNKKLGIKTSFLCYTFPY